MPAIKCFPIFLQSAPLVVTLWNVTAEQMHPFPLHPHHQLWGLPRLLLPHIANVINVQITFGNARSEYRPQGRARRVVNTLAIWRRRVEPRRLPFVHQWPLPIKPAPLVTPTAMWKIRNHWPRRLTDSHGLAGHTCFVRLVPFLGSWFLCTGDTKKVALSDFLAPARKKQKRQNRMPTKPPPPTATLLKKQVHCKKSREDRSEWLFTCFYSDWTILFAVPTQLHLAKKISPSIV